jgi:hypothetical protein
MAFKQVSVLHFEFAHPIPIQVHENHVVEVVFHFLRSLPQNASYLIAGGTRESRIVTFDFDFDFDGCSPLLKQVSDRG